MNKIKTIIYDSFTIILRSNYIIAGLGYQQQLFKNPIPVRFLSK